MKKFALIALLVAIALTLCCCGVWGNDATSDVPDYHPVPPSDDVQLPEQESEKLYEFTLELRMPSEKTEISDGDLFAHSTDDGELVKQWTVPVYGNTLYESVVKFFENGEDKITFRLSQHRFYMFHDCALADGRYYDLETCYVSVDGKYGNAANFQTLQGEDGVFGTDDDVKTVTLVYKGWLY